MRPQLLGQLWKICDRCGWTYPISKLTKNKSGFLICAMCWDKADKGDPEAGD